MIGLSKQAHRGMLLLEHHRHHPHDPFATSDRCDDRMFVGRICGVLGTTGHLVHGREGGGVSVKT